MKSFQSFNEQTYKKIDEILNLEWDMFDKTQNIDGRASCQNNKDTFILARKNQFMSWNDSLITSYLDDLKIATKNHINLVSQKYGYMMQFTHPQEYDKIKNLLLPISDFKKNAVNEIVKIQVEWMEAFHQKYPQVPLYRNIHSSKDTKSETSFETYFIGELYSYSDKTIAEYIKYIQILYNENENMQELLYINSIKE